MQRKKAWHDAVAVKKNVSSFLIVLLLATIYKTHAAEMEVPGMATPPPEVLKLLQDLDRQYGTDTVALLGWLLDAVTHCGSVLTASVRVNGHEARADGTFLVFQVETGLIFNTRTTDQSARLLVLWEKILAKAFAYMDTLDVPADGVMIDLFYHNKSFAESEDVTEHVDEPGPVEEAKFYFRGDPLRAFLDEKLSPQELFTHTQVLVNDAPVTLTLSDGAKKTDTSHKGQGTGPS